jgi:hypothetical protein
MSSDVLFLIEGDIALESLWCCTRLVEDGERNSFLPEDDEGRPKKKFAMLVRFALVAFALAGEMGERCGGMGESPTPPAASRLMYDETGPRLGMPERRWGERMLLRLGSMALEFAVVRDVVDCARPLLYPALSLLSLVLPPPYRRITSASNMASRPSSSTMSPQLSRFRVSLGTSYGPL